MDENFDNGKLFDNRYRLERRLGSGGMADVYLATDESLGRQVAIKILSDRYARDDGFVERFRREASAAASLNHPNIVAVYDRGEAEGTYYIAMEFLDGPTLKQEITRRAPLPEAEAIGWATQALDALDFAHRRGVIHRDVKPHNMVLTHDSRLKVTDFGIARAQNTVEMTEVGSIVGTAQYLSPEQARGQTVGPQSDLYSMGIVLYEMLTGELPFTGDGAVDIAMKQVSDQPPSLSAKNRLVSPELEQVVMRALAKDPALRHSSARAMADELRRVSRGGEVSADTQQATQVISAQQAAATSVLPPPYVPPETAGPKRSVWPWLLVVLFLVVAAAIGVIVYNQISGDQVTVPGGITGGTCAQAKARLATVGLKGDCVVAKNETVKPGVIFAANPSPGSSVDSGSTVKLSQSGGPNTATMENLSGLSQSDATSKLRDQGFTDITVLSVDSPAQTEGNVVSTKPVPGKTVPTSTAVELDVASGSVIVPTIGSNLDYNQASKKLQQQKLAPIKAEASDPTVPVGFVISISPVAGVRVEQGRQITVTISTGPGQGTVPAVKGFTASTATSALEQAGFKAAVIDYNSCTDQANDGLVTSQHPGGGTPATQGTKVYIRVDHYTPTDPSCTSPPTT